MLVYFELHCLTSDRLTHEIRNVSFNPSDDMIKIHNQIKSNYEYSIHQIHDTKYEYDFIIMVDFDKFYTTHNVFLDEKIEIVKRIYFRRCKLNKIINGASI
jgi:hypothetical protein